VAARSPVIVAGREINAFGGAADLRQIAELLGAPVCGDLFASHSPLTFPTFHPQYAGFFAEDDKSPKGYDLFWSVGGTMFTAAGATPEPIVPRGVKVVHTTIDTTELGRTYPVDVPMMARTDLSVRAVLEELRARRLPAGVADERRRSVVNA